MKLPEKVGNENAGFGIVGLEFKINEIIDYLKEREELEDRRYKELDNRIQVIANNQLGISRGNVESAVVGVAKQMIADLPKDTPKRWRAKFEGFYWFVNHSGGTRKTIEVEDQYDDFRYAIGNYFQTEQEAQAYKEKLLEMGRNSN